jgi:hypothetical protein
MQRGRASVVGPRPVPDELLRAVNTGPELFLYDTECIYSCRCGVLSGKNNLQDRLPDSTAGSLIGCWGCCDLLSWPQLNDMSALALNKTVILRQFDVDDLDSTSISSESRDHNSQGGFGLRIWPWGFGGQDYDLAGQVSNAEREDEKTRAIYNNVHQGVFGLRNEVVKSTHFSLFCLDRGME